MQLQKISSSQSKIDQQIKRGGITLNQALPVLSPQSKSFLASSAKSDCMVTVSRTVDNFRTLPILLIQDAISKWNLWRYPWWHVIMEWIIKSSPQTAFWAQASAFGIILEADIMVKIINFIVPS